MSAAARDRRHAGNDNALPKVRVPLIRRARVQRAGSTEELFVIDLGLRGIFLEREEALPEGETVAVSFHLPGNEIPVEAQCRVAWWHPADKALVSKQLPAGVGLEFVDMSPGDRARVKRHLEEYLAQSPRQRRFHRHPQDVDLDEE